MKYRLCACDGLEDLLVQVIHATRTKHPELSLNCGTGDGGFQEGNTCQKGGGSGGGSSGGSTGSDKSKAQRAANKAKVAKRKANQPSEVPAKIKDTRDFKKPDEIIQWTTEQSQAHYADSIAETRDMTHMVRRYQGSHQPIQDHLRHGGPGRTMVDGDITETVRELDTIIEKLPGTPEAITLHRGIKGHIPGLEAGDSIMDAGYVSTSMDPDIAPAFTKIKGGTSKPAILKIRAAKGSKMLPINMYTDNYSFKDEHEMLLPRGSQLKITKVSYKGKTQLIEAEYDRK